MDYYVTTYCNRPHEIATGRPVDHECYVLRPESLRAEMRDDYSVAPLPRHPRIHRGIKRDDV